MIINIKRVRFKQILFFSLACLLIFSPLTEARRIQSPGNAEIDIFSLNGPIIGSDGYVSIDGKTLKLSPNLASKQLVRLTENSYVIVSPGDEAMEYLVDLEFVDSESAVSEVIDVDGRGLLKPLPLGSDSLQFASNFLENRVVSDVKTALLGYSSDYAYTSFFDKISDSDWERLKSISNKFGLQRLTEYFAKAARIGVKNPVCYLLDAESNPRYALETVEEIPDIHPSDVGAAADLQYVNPPVYIVNSKTDLIEYKISQFIVSFIQQTRGRLVERMDASGVDELLSALAQDINEGLRLVIKKIGTVMDVLKRTGEAKPITIVRNQKLIFEDIGFIMKVLEDFAKGEIEDDYRALTDSDPLPTTRQCYINLNSGSEQKLEISSEFNWNSLYDESNLNIRFYISGGGEQQFRVEKGKQGRFRFFTLDLDSDILGILWNAWGSMRSVSPVVPANEDWRGHHYRLGNFERRIKEIYNFEGPEEIKRQIETIFKLIFPLSDQRYGAMVITEILEIFC